jgi:hypothetical protein
LQIREITFVSKLRILSSLLALGALVYCYGLPAYIARLFWKGKITRRKSKKYEVFIEDYDVNELHRRTFGFWVVFKKTVQCTALVLFYYIPIVQCLVPWMMNLVVLVLLARNKPHHKGVLNLYDTIYEIGFFGLHSAVTVLAYYDTTGFGTYEVRETVGAVILTFLGLILCCSLTQIWVENITTIRKMLANLKMMFAKDNENKKRRRKVERRREKLVELAKRLEEDKGKEKSGGQVKKWKKRYAEGWQPGDMEL